MTGESRKLTVWNEEMTTRMAFGSFEKDRVLSESNSAAALRALRKVGRIVTGSETK